MTRSLFYVINSVLLLHLLLVTAVWQASDLALKTGKKVTEKSKSVKTWHRNDLKSSGRRVGKKVDMNAIVTPYTHNFSPSLTVHTDGGYGLHPEWI